MGFRLETILNNTDSKKITAENRRCPHENEGLKSSLNHEE